MWATVKVMHNTRVRSAYGHYSQTLRASAARFLKASTAVNTTML